MGTAISIILTLFVHLLHPGSAHVTAQVMQTDDVTPTVAPTITASPSPTTTPTPTTDVSPTPRVVPTGDGDKDDMLGLKADAHAFFGLMNAALHHEQNEARFDAKHGTKDNSETEQ